MSRVESQEGVCLPQRVFVSGGSGFVGSAVISELLQRGYGVNVLVHRGSLKLQHERLNVVRPDLFSVDELAKALSGCDAVIHLVGIIRENPRRGFTFERMHAEATRCVVDAAAKANVRRYIQMSAQGARINAPSRYHQTKAQAEDYVRASPLDWTIFRPSLIHGPGGEFTQMQAAWARGSAMPFLFMPYFGSGLLGRGPATKVQPIVVTDVARAFVDALEKPLAVHQIYELGGSERLTWPQMHHIAAEAFAGKRKPAIAIPTWYALLLAAVAPGAWLPFNRDQVLMAREDNIADNSRFVSDFGWQPRGYRDAVQGYRAQV